MVVQLATPTPAVRRIYVDAPTTPRRTTALPAPARMTIDEAHMPPLPMPIVRVNADVGIRGVASVFVAVRLSNIPAPQTVTVSGSATAQEFGGAFAVLAPKGASVVASAAAYIGFFRTAAQTVGVAAAASKLVQLLAAQAVGVTASASATAKAAAPAPQTVAVTTAANISAVGGQVTVTATQTIITTPAATVTPAFTTAGTQTATVTASATIVEREKAAPAQSVAVTATVIAVPAIRAPITAGVTATAAVELVTSFYPFTFPAKMN